MILQMLSMAFGALLLIISIALYLMMRNAKINSKSKDHVNNAREMLKNDFESNLDFAALDKKGIKVIKNKNGKYIIKSQSRLINSSFFS